MPGWYTVSVCQVVNNTYINPSYKDLMKLVPGTFRWLMYLSPFTLPPTFSHNKPCLRRCSACPSPHGQGHVFMFFRLDRPIVPSKYYNMSKALLHFLLRILPQNITLSDGNKYNNFTSLLYNKSVSFPHSLCKILLEMLNQNKDFLGTWRCNKQTQLHNLAKAPQYSYTTCFESYVTSKSFPHIPYNFFV